MRREKDRPGLRDRTGADDAGCLSIDRPYGIKTIVSLNPIMWTRRDVRRCRVSGGGKTKFTCVDGPEFDGHEVDFNLLSNRLRMYSKQEKQLSKLTGANAMENKTQNRRRKKPPATGSRAGPQVRIRNFNEVPSVIRRNMRLPRGRALHPVQETELYGGLSRRM